MISSQAFIQHHAQGHCEDGKERGHAEQLGGIGGIFLVIEALHGAHCRRGSSGSSEDGHFHDAVKGEAEKEEDDCRRNDEEL